MDIVENEKTLQELLSKSNVKQVEMAEILRISESHVSLLVSGKRRMSVDYAATFAKRLNITIDEVFHAVNFAKSQDHITLKLVGKADGVSKLSQYNSNPKLADFRNTVGRTPEEMAKELDVPLEHYTKVELGKEAPNGTLINRFKTKFPKANTDLIFFGKAKTSQEATC